MYKWIRDFYTLISVNDIFDVKIYADGREETTTYYKANNELIAKKEIKNGIGTITYHHNDHLGSASMVTSTNGVKVEETKYLPYGEVRSGGNENLTGRYTYTGQESDGETGLMYYGARYYSAEIGRFVQPDSMLPDIYDPQQLNRYAYVRNNPLKYVDPSGNFSLDFSYLRIFAFTNSGFYSTDQVSFARLALLESADRYLANISNPYKVLTGAGDAAQYGDLGENLSTAYMLSSPVGLSKYRTPIIGLAENLGGFARISYIYKRDTGVWKIRGEMDKQLNYLLGSNIPTARWQHFSSSINQVYKGVISGETEYNFLIAGSDTVIQVNYDEGNEEFTKEDFIKAVSILLLSDDHKYISKKEAEKYKNKHSKS